mmetsp:Transcript_2656/g.5626  ORF Transcript_2656/g.5626 Transcript_2656/m.5626 type:complete len:230 (-) Transcript_2656:701-1390(-)
MMIANGRGLGSVPPSVDAGSHEGDRHDQPQDEQRGGHLLDADAGHRPLSRLALRHGGELELCSRVGSVGSKQRQHLTQCRNGIGASWKCHGVGLEDGSCLGQSAPGRRRPRLPLGKHVVDRDDRGTLVVREGGDDVVVLGKNYEVGCGSSVTSRLKLEFTNADGSSLGRGVMDVFELDASHTCGQKRGKICGVSVGVSINRLAAHAALDTRMRNPMDNTIKRPAKDSGE